MGKKLEWLKGVVVSQLTPFDDYEAIDEQRLRGLVDFLIDKDIHCLFPLSVTGEFYRLTLREREQVIDLTVDQVNGRVPVLVGCHTFATKLSIKLARYASDAGADGIVLLHPYGMGCLRLDEDALYKHYKEVSEAVGIPMAIYTESGVANELSIDLLDRIAGLDNCIGIKLSTTDMARFQRGVQRLSDKISVLTGIEGVYVTTLTYGGQGGFLGTANMIPEYWVDTYNLYTRGRVDEAQAMQQKYISMEQAVIGKYGFTETIKEALNIRGIPVGNTRRPGKRLPKGAKGDITEFLLRLGIPVN